MSNIDTFVKELQRGLDCPREQVVRTVKIEGYSQEIELRGLAQDVLESVEAHSPDDVQAQNAYTVYVASPTLQEAAKKLLQLGAIDVAWDVMRCFHDSDINAMCKIVAEITYEYNKPQVKLVDTVKN